ncbi:MAG: SH3 domain-containing protein [Silvibacterium sp.]|nr:SH3 domain-containing protein [Silvibacterium sp.]
MLLAALSGCGRFSTRPPPEYVYVSAKGTYLRDRLAAVSNRVAQVSNGQKLLVLARARRFVKVKTDKGEIGWLDERAVIDQDTFEKFKVLATQHEHDPIIVSAVLRDDAYLHLTPGRQTEHYYLLPENTRFQVLARASVPKPGPPQAVAAPKPKVKHTADGAQKTPPKPADSTAAAPPPAPVLQDWYLVRDTEGRAGWVWAHMLDVDIPNEISGLAEGQKYVGAYILRTVDDSESSFPNGKAPEYLALMNSWKEGLPWDFDQVRVFTWNTKRHRYETAFRQRNLQGYLPVTISSKVFNKQSEPVFSYRVSTGEDVAIDPQSGSAHPANLETETYRMEGVLVKKVEPPSAAPPPASAKTATPEKEKNKHKPEAHHRKRH